MRAQRFAKLIKIAEVIFFLFKKNSINIFFQNFESLGNFSSLMAFLGGFNNSAIARLKFTKELIPKKVQEV